MHSMTTFEQDYVNLVLNILTNGEQRPSRAGPTFGLFSRTLTFAGLPYKEFPILEGRKIFYQGVLGELAAMLRGPKHVDDFKKFGCNYWGPWANIDGSLDLDYGNSWLDYNGVNQLQAVIDSLKNDPFGRRHIIIGYRPDKVIKQQLSLPSCHMLYQWHVGTNENGQQQLNMHWYQRSTDVMIGLPSDVILAAAWNIMMAKETGYIPGTLYFTWGDTHIYMNHEEQARQYLHQVSELKYRDVVVPQYMLDNAKPSGLFDFNPETINVINYRPGPAIHFPISV